MTLLEVIQEKLSKRQLIAIAAMYFATQEGVSNYQMIAVVALAVCTITSYTVLSWKYGPDKVNGKDEPVTPTP